uniref:Uncharacterized protein n=1 Tax=Oryza rufipogon TaxID=4529 RepID=A0A0E0PWB5_ORYRU
MLKTRHYDRHRTLEAPARPKSPNNRQTEPRARLNTSPQLPKGSTAGWRRPKEGRSPKESRGRHEEDVRAEVRGNKDHVVFHDSGEELRLLQDISYDCSNHHQLYHQCREGDTGVSRRATKECWREEGRKGCGEGEEGNGGVGFNSYRRRVAGGRETTQRGTEKGGGHQGRRKGCRRRGEVTGGQTRRLPARAPEDRPPKPTGAATPPRGHRQSAAHAPAPAPPRVSAALHGCASRLCDGPAASQATRRRSGRLQPRLLRFAPPHDTTAAGALPRSGDGGARSAAAWPGSLAVATPGRRRKSPPPLRLRGGHHRGESPAAAFLARQPALPAVR